MVASRPSRLSPTGLADGGPAPATPPARRKLMIALAVLVPAILLAVAWFDGGEEALRPIAEPVALPGQAR
jgi:hypothetical protein